MRQVTRKQNIGGVTLNGSAGLMAQSTVSCDASVQAFGAARELAIEHLRTQHSINADCKQRLQAIVAELADTRPHDR